MFLGAGLGANARYWLGGWISERWGTSFPWGTLVINVSGSALIGLVMGVLLQTPVPIWWRLLIVIGFLGGYTTFSTFSYETLSLLMDRNYGPAALNVVAACLLSFFGTWLGLVAARALTGA